MKLQSYQPHHFAFIGLISAAWVIGLFAFQGRVGFSLWDEGFLWYGVQRVLLGDIPLRDFMSYDPGRYYWSAAWLSLFGSHGIVSLRATVAVFQFFGLFVGLYCIAKSIKKPQPYYLMACAFVLVIWMFPRHKLFDISISIFTIGLMTFLIQNRSKQNFLWAGIGVGVIAFFGRNHGLYAVFAHLCFFVWLAISAEKNQQIIQKISWWMLGVLIGYFPMIGMLLGVDGFAAAFLYSIQFLLEVKSTNISLPIPWPWQVDFKSLGILEATKKITLGIYFLCIVAYGIMGWLWILTQKWKKQTVPPLLVATVFVSLPYAHYAYSRADIGHLAHGIFPMLIGLLFLFSKQSFKIKWLLIGILLTSSWLIVANSHPAWLCYAQKNCEPIKVSQQQLWVPTPTKKYIELLQELSSSYTAQGESFLATPFWPGAYALLERPSPMWEIYALFPRGEKFERIEIEKIKQANPQFIVLTDYVLDNRTELMFRHTHPLVFQYIQDNYKLDRSRGNETIKVYLR